MLNRSWTPDRPARQACPKASWTLESGSCLAATQLMRDPAWEWAGCQAQNGVQHFSRQLDALLTAPLTANPSCPHPCSCCRTGCYPKATALVDGQQLSGSCAEGWWEVGVAFR